MVDAERKVLKDYQWRAQLPRYFRIGAVAAVGIAVLVVAVGFFNARSRSPFKLRGEHAQLSTEVTAEVSGYERLESENGVPQYLIKADYAKTFADNHQELTNVHIEVYDDQGQPGDKLSAANALYIPEEGTNFAAYLNGNVNIETRDQLKIKTNNLVYTRKNEIADSDEAIEFEHAGIKGRSFGASFNLGERRIELLKDVVLESAGFLVNAGYASYDQQANLVELKNGMSADVATDGGAGRTKITAGRAVATLGGQDDAAARFKTFEAFENVRIESGPTVIDSGYAKYDRAADRFDLKGGMHMVSSGSDIRAGEALYERTAGKLLLTGGAEIVQGQDKFSGSTVQAELSGNKLKNAVIRGDARASKTSPERTIAVAAAELNATFGDAGLLNASAVGQSTFEIVPTDTATYSRINGSAGRGIGAGFRSNGDLEAIRTDGRTTIDLNVNNTDAESANKRLTADAVKTSFGNNGNMSRAEAVGNAELEVIPLNAGPKQFRTTVTAPRFDCDFFSTGNNVEVCVAGKRAKAVRVPTVQGAKRGTQTLSADKMTARFDQRSGDVSSMAAAGNAKFNELDRNGSAGEMTFAQADEVVRLRGGEPTVWNDSGRAKAREIDMDTRSDRSYLRGGVSTTYYSLKKSGSAAPFASPEKPVFVTADNAEYDHASDSALYRGNARSWQENNYVRADSLFYDERKGALKAEGRVESALYTAKSGGGTQPVFATAATLTYQRDERILRYRNAVDIRQSTDRLTASAADLYLDADSNIAKTVVQNDVVLTQPGRRATGDWAQFTAEDEVAIIRGEPATVSDRESGSSQGREMTFRLKEEKVAIDSRPRSGTVPGRTRSVYKINGSP